MIRCVCGKKIGPDPRNFNQRVSLGRNDLLIRTFLKENRPLSEREKINVNKNNFNSVLSEFSPEVNLSVPNTLAGNGEEENVRLRFTDIKDFEPEQVARQIPQLRAMLAMRNLLRDLKSNLLDNATFRKELEAILKDPALSQELRDEMSALAPK
ncbi:type VI secretion system contractile sheath small subunit [Klebsiella pneumoniae]|uniref:type VI secretion system contractile sheath small subunit n=1 Tax=Klebsiella pneumoniae TaxID=573 RepID=UPI003A805979